MDYEVGLRRFSQFGEDGVILWFFDGRRNGFYVDVGCHDPYRFSNTAALHLDFGWRGINIDVDDRAAARFQAARPNDLNLCIGVAAESGQLEAAFFEEGAVNSLDACSAASPVWAHSLKERRLVDVLPLREILNRHAFEEKVDFLNVDAEGLDYDILTSNDWARFRPSCVAVETHGFNLAHPSSDRTFKLMTDHGYRLLSHVVVTSIYTLP